MSTYIDHPAGGRVELPQEVENEGPAAVDAFLTAEFAKLSRVYPLPPIRSDSDAAPASADAAAEPSARATKRRTPAEE